MSQKIMTYPNNGVRYMISSKREYNLQTFYTFLFTFKYINLYMKIDN